MVTLRPEIRDRMYWVHLALMAAILTWILQRVTISGNFVTATLAMMGILAALDIFSHTLLGVD